VPRSAIEPHRHAGLECGRITLRIEAHAQRIAVVITHRALGLPRRKRPQRQELRDQRRGRVARARPSHVDHHSRPDAVQEIFPDVEGQPLLSSFFDGQHWLAGADVLPTSATITLTTPSAGARRSVFSKRRSRTASAAAAASTCASAMARVHAAAAKTAGLPLDKVVVHNHLIGGGFGRPGRGRSSFI
jgi:hypothetical protein